jgi:hypothetical protein
MISTVKPLSSLVVFARFIANASSRVDQIFFDEKNNAKEKN